MALVSGILVERNCTAAMITLGVELDVVRLDGMQPGGQRVAFGEVLALVAAIGGFVHQAIGRAGQLIDRLQAQLVDGAVRPRAAIPGRRCRIDLIASALGFLDEFHDLRRRTFALQLIPVIELMTSHRVETKGAKIVEVTRPEDLIRSSNPLDAGDEVFGLIENRELLDLYLHLAPGRSARWPNDCVAAFRGRVRVAPAGFVVDARLRAGRQTGFEVDRADASVRAMKVEGDELPLDVTFALDRDARWRLDDVIDP